MCTKATTVEPQTVTDAMSMLHSALDYLNAADVHELGMEQQRQALTQIGQVAAKTSVFRAAALAAFDAAGGPEADGCKTAASWLMHRGRMSKSAARQDSKWSRTMRAHPAVATALAGEKLTESLGKLICELTDRLPDEVRGEADQILINAAAGGCADHELRIIAARIWEECKKTRTDDDPDPDDDPFADRSLTLDETIDGVGRLRGDLTPQATAALRAILDSLGKHRGPEDTRTATQRMHDALAEALDMLLAAGGLPRRHGTATHGEVDIPITALRDMPGASELEEMWLHSHTRGAPVYLTGPAAQGAACDATLFPMVTGSPDWAIVDQIIEITLEVSDRSRALTDQEWDGLRCAIGQLCLDFVSGPRGAAAMLRRALLDGPLASASLPLDIGYSETTPAWLRKAVIRRDRHCQWPGGCDAPPARCDIHHIVPKGKGGKTSLANTCLMCWFHHLIAIHAWGWVLSMQAGVMKVTSPDGKLSYTSRAPPARQAA